MEYNSDTETEYTIICESPVTTEAPTLGTFTGRKESSVCGGSQTEGHGDIAPLWDKKFSDFESRLDRLKRNVDSLKSTHLYTVIQLNALNKRVDDLEKAGGGIRDAIEGVRDDISSLRRANDETLMHLDEEIEKERVRNMSTTKRIDISVSLRLDFSNLPNNPTTN